MDQRASPSPRLAEGVARRAFALLELNQSVLT